MNLFYYIFYRAYNSTWKDEGDEYTACFSITVLISLNLLTAGIYLLSYFNIRPAVLFLSSWYALIVIGAVAIAVFYWFFRVKDYERLLEEYEGSDNEDSWTYAMWTYVVLSVILFMTAMIHIDSYDEKLLRREQVITTAEITETNVRIKTNKHSYGYFFKYKFIVNGQTYTNAINQKYYKADGLIPGDSCMVAYARSYPEVNNVAVDKKSGSLIIKRNRGRFHE